MTPEVGRALLFAVDVAYTAVAMEKGIQPGFHNNPHDGVLSIRRVKELAAEHGAEVFLSHDMDAWHGYRHARTKVLSPAVSLIFLRKPASATPR